MVDLTPIPNRSFQWGPKVTANFEALNEAKLEEADVTAIADERAEAKFLEVVADPEDATVAALVEAPASATATALNSTFAPAGIFGGTLCAIYGDSLANNGQGYPWWIAALSRQQFSFPSSSYVVSYPGQTSGQMKDAITGITGLAVKPQLCLISAGSNDAGSGVTPTTYIANIDSMCDALRAAGIEPVLLGVPPRSGVVGLVAEYNFRLRRYAAQNRVALIDCFGLFVNPVTEQFATAYDSGDGVHPSAAGVKLLAQRFVTEMGKLAPRPLDLWALASGANIHTGSIFNADANADGLANGLSATPSTGFTFSRVADTDGFWWQRMSLAAASGDKQILLPALRVGSGSTTLSTAASSGATSLVSAGAITTPGLYRIQEGQGKFEYIRITAISGTGPYTLTLAPESPLKVAYGVGATISPAFAVGDRIGVAARFRNGQDSTKFVVENTCYTADYGAVTLNAPLTTPNSANGFVRRVEDAVGYREFTIPESTDLMQMRMIANGSTDGTYDIALPLVVNLTALGLA